MADANVKQISGKFADGSGDYSLGVGLDGIAKLSLAYSKDAASVNVVGSFDVGSEARKLADKADGIVKTGLDLLAKLFGK